MGQDLVRIDRGTKSLVLDIDEKGIQTGADRHVDRNVPRPAKAGISGVPAYLQAGRGRI